MNYNLNKETIQQLIKLHNTTGFSSFPTQKTKTYKHPGMPLQGRGAPQIIFYMF